METFLKGILKDFEIEENKVVETTISKLIQNAKVSDLEKSMTSIKKQVLDLFNMYRDKEEFREKNISLPNANAKKEYQFSFDPGENPNIIIRDIKNLDIVGLRFDAENCCITGTPTVANNINIQIVFYNKNDKNETDDIKVVPFVVNADPKDLWIDKPSDKGSRFAKSDTASLSATFLDKKIVIASKRGRSHAHAGTFRDDDFYVQDLPDDWAIAAIADGAGSAQYARMGSQIATEFISKSFDDSDLLTLLSNHVTDFFCETIEPEMPDTVESDHNPSIANENKDTAPDHETTEKQTNNNKLQKKSAIINILYKSVRNLYHELKNFADKEALSIKDLNTTIIFSLAKKFEFGYVVLTFGVGDCPINILTDNDEKVQLLNVMDVGDVGGATRFITMNEIFSNPDMGSRFGINCFEDFSKLFLMTDGIYDPKFLVESKLENIENWKEFLKDLNGENEEMVKVDFEEDTDIEAQLLHWMDFWSKGNHDDRTIAIIY
ncbi:protein phosphatase 2C domain-containing protein [Chryseobacterium sp.]|uniref:protein phosphatase 2C domain-containing protein n=1 Tax=Chryseobacterium sp. TaxID=1871047 RepID=UPI002633C3BA|nr:protein phosphatase 2C domain-containing protein [Chryseobacterium sp.]